MAQSGAQRYLLEALRRSSAASSSAAAGSTASSPAYVLRQRSASAAGATSAAASGSKGESGSCNNRSSSTACRDSDSLRGSRQQAAEGVAAAATEPEAAAATPGAWVLRTSSASLNLPSSTLSFRALSCAPPQPPLPLSSPFRPVLLTVDPVPSAAPVAALGASTAASATAPLTSQLRTTANSTVQLRNAPSASSMLTAGVAASVAGMRSFLTSPTSLRGAAPPEDAGEGGSGRKSAVIHVASPSHFRSILEDSPPNQLIVVDFTAVWCRPCQLIAPVVDALSVQQPGVKFLKVDIDEEEVSDIVEDARVTGVPTFQFFKGAKLVSSFSGADSRKLHDTIDMLTAHAV